MARFVLHIGCEKTGTTSIQTLLSRNADQLLERYGLLYPTSPPLFDRIAHFPVAAALLPVDRREFLPGGLHTDAESVKNALQSLATHPQAKTVLISCEQLSARFREYNAAELADMLRPFEVEVLIYLRPQEQTAVSAWSTRVMAGHREPLTIDEVVEQNHYFNLDEIVSTWSKVFGQSRMQIRLFERKRWTNGDFVDDFLAAIGINDRSGLEPAPTRNRSMNARLARLLLNLNAQLPTWKEALTAGDPGSYWQANQTRDRLLQLVQEDPHSPLALREPRIQLTTAQRDLIRARFAPSNARLASIYFGRQELFEQSSGEVDTGPSENHLDDDYAQLLAQCSRTLLSVEQEFVTRWGAQAAEIESCNAQLERIRQSRSWQFSAPLRMLGSTARRLLRGRNRTSEGS